MKRKYLLRGVAALALLIAIVGVAAVAGQDRIIHHIIRRELARPDPALLTDGQLHVVTVGTGTPRAVPDRVGACTAVIADGEFLMFDAGPGSIRQADLVDLPITALSTVFLTHLHSDHMGGLGQTINHTWIWGRTAPLDVYGPEGTVQVVDGFRAAYDADIHFRSGHLGEEISPLAGGTARAHTVVPDGETATLVFDRNGVRVYAFAVDHGIVRPALGYRIEWRGRRVVISGDTKRYEPLAVHARGADLLIHEAYRTELVLKAADVFEELGQPARAAQVRILHDYHTHPRDAADLAQQAGVKHLVFTHVIPTPINGFVRRQILRGVRDRFDGPITIASDGMRFVLEPSTRDENK